MEQLTPVQLSNMVDTQFAGKTIKFNSFKTEPLKINGLESIPLFTDGNYAVLMVDEVNFVKYTEFFDIKREYFYTFKDGMAFIFTNDEKLLTPEIFESADIAQYVKRFLVNVFDDLMFDVEEFKSKRLKIFDAVLFRYGINGQQFFTFFVKDGQGVEELTKFSKFYPLYDVFFYPQSSGYFVKLTTK